MVNEQGSVLVIPQPQHTAELSARERLMLLRIARSRSALSMVHTVSSPNGVIAVRAAETARNGEAVPATIPHPNMVVPTAVLSVQPRKQKPATSSPALLMVDTATSPNGVIAVRAADRASFFEAEPAQTPLPHMVAPTAVLSVKLRR
jgi:hypothetical protein